MIILGAKGFAKEVLQVCHEKKDLKTLVFYDDVNDDIGDYLYDEFRILKTLDEAKAHFNNLDSRFTIGIGNPMLRYKLFKKFEALGGQLTSTISKNAIIGDYGNIVKEGCNIMANTVLTNDIKVGQGVIINQLASIGHDVVIGDFCEICPNVSVSGNCEIKAFTFLGTGATILPKIKIGSNVVIGAGAVVTKDIPDNSIAFGAPAKVVKNLEPLNL